jgi:hypothetical protein
MTKRNELPRTETHDLDDAKWEAAANGLGSYELGAIALGRTSSYKPSSDQLHAKWMRDEADKVTKIIDSEPARRRNRASGGPQFGEEEGTNYENGKPPYFDHHTPMSPDQTKTYKRGSEMVKRVITELKD